jgi:immune inhibitor A
MFARRRWLLYLGLTLGFLMVCYFAACGITGFLWGRATKEWAGPPRVQGPGEPTPEAPPSQRLPSTAEEETLHALAEVTLPRRDLVDLAQRLGGLSISEDALSAGDPPGYDLGDREVFWVHDIGASRYYTASATLAYETDHAYWWLEEGMEVGQPGLARSAQNFEEITYPTTRRLFGSEPNPGIDGDPHVYIFLGDVPGVAGYFSGPDVYPAQIRAHSNEHEMFYINLDNAPPGNDYFDGVLAHEFAHMIQWQVDRDEDTWVNEGLAELSSLLNGYDVGGSDLHFLAQPDTQLTTWPDLEDSGPHYGASYLFLAYFLERYGEEALLSLASEPANGVAGFDAVLARVDPDTRFADLFADWVVANYLDDPDPAAGSFGYASLQLDHPTHSAQHREHPTVQRASVRQHAVDYVMLEGEGDLQVRFHGSTLVSLLGNEVHSGAYQWWAVRGDEGDATLTRAFDLSGLSKATLQVWTWYDLEEDYDYAYVALSADGGETWELLSNEHTTTDDPTGDSYGPALNGRSGGGPTATWVEQTFDLSPYAGQGVLVRFEVVTDESVTRPGLALDDFSIPELGYADDVEDGDGGWQAEGWLRVTEKVPQSFLVQIISLGSSPRAQRLVLDAENRGELTISGLGTQMDRAILAISAMTRFTTEPATYSYETAPKEPNDLGGP